MASLISPVHRIRCDQPGCNKSYLRVEHLNRHRLTHESSMFRCCLCTKQFSRNDLLHAHLRRHEKRNEQGLRSAGKRTRRISSSESTTNKQLSTSVPNSSSIFAVPSPDDALSGPWQSPIEDPGMIDVQQHTADQTQGGGSSSHGRQPSITALPSPLDVMATATSHHQIPPETTTSIWQPSSTIEDGDLLSQNIEFHWPFGNGGIFGLPGDAYFELGPTDPFEGYLDDFSNVQDDASFRSLEFPEPITTAFLNEENVMPMPPEVYQSILLEFPELVNDRLGDPLSLFRLYRLALDYTDITMPFFHRPTLKLASLPPLLILTLCSLGAWVGNEPDAYPTGQLIHSHVWRRIFIMTMELKQVDIWTLETMILLEHIAFYALSRSAHEKADVFHAMLVTLARRTSLLAQDFDANNGSRQPLEKRWEEWAKRETIKRVSYTIFVHDVDYSMHFMYPSLLSLGMMKLPLPCSTALWQAKTAEEWERQTDKMRQPSRVSSSLRSLRASIELLLPTYFDHSRQRRPPGALQTFTSSAFTLQVLIHGLASAILEHRFRGIDSGCTQGMHVLKVREFEHGLASWYSCFENMDLASDSAELARSSLITYHSVAILLRESLSDIQMAAGTAYSWGRAVTPRRAQDAFLRIVSRQPVAQEAYDHALKIMSLCLDDDNNNNNNQNNRDRTTTTTTTTTASSEAPPPPTSRTPALYPLYLTYNTFIAVLVLWAYALGLSRSESVVSQREQARNPVWAMDGGQLKLIEATQLERGRGTGSSSSSNNNNVGNGGGDGSDSTATPTATATPTSELGRILQRGLTRREAQAQEAEAIRGDVRRLMSMVRQRLAGSRWELAHEARQVLDALLDKNGFME